MLTRTCLCALLCTTAAAQDAPPPSPVLQLEVAGPAGVRRAFLPTNLGSMLAGEEARTLWPQLFAGMHGLWGKAEGKQGYDAFLDRVLAYDGRIRGSLWLDVPAAAAPWEVRGTLVVALGKDRDTDLAALGAGLTRLLRAGMAWPERSLSGPSGEHAALVAPGGMGVTLPALVGGELVSVWSNDLAASMADEALAARLAWRAPAAGKRPPPWSASLDLEQVADIARDYAKRTNSRDESAMAASFFGLSTLRRFAVTAWPAGPHVALELSLTWEGGERGAALGVFPGTSGVPSLLHLAPGDGAPWKVGRFDPGRFYDACVRAVGEYDVVGTTDEVRGMVNRQFDLDLEEDFLAHLSDEALVLGNFWELDEADDAEKQEQDDISNGMCVAWLVKGDSARVDASWSKVLAMFERIVVGKRRDQEEYGGVTIRYAELYETGPDFYWATTERLFLMAMGDRGLERLRGLIDAEKKAEWGEAPVLPATIARLRRSAPPGLNGMAQADSGVLLGHQLPEFFDLLLDWADLPELEGMNALELPWQFFLPLLEKYRLGQVVTLTGYEDETWRSRALW